MRFQENFQSTIQATGSQDLDLIFDSRAKGSLFIQLMDDCSNLNLRLDVQTSANVKVFIYNASNLECTLDVQGALAQASFCQFALFDMQESALTWNQKIELLGPEAKFEVYSGQLCQRQIQKKNAMEIIHKASHTEGLMHNFAVLFDHGHYEMVANGNIEKGCKEAQSHQQTRVLTLGKDHVTKVIPLLLIDENDVKASHALSMGQPDQEQLYYLQSRGLSVTQAIGLLSVGYLLPVIGLIEDETLRMSLQEQMESRVGLYGQQSHS